MSDQLVLTLKKDVKFNTLPFEKKENCICGEKKHKLRMTRRHAKLDIVVISDRRTRFPYHVFECHV